MDTRDIKHKILNGEMSDEELAEMLDQHSKSETSGEVGFMASFMKNIRETTARYNLSRSKVEVALTFFVIVGIVVLSYMGRIDAMSTSILLAFVLGFLFGKNK